LKESRKKEQKFLADVSHELRNPLAVMKAGVEFNLEENLSEDERKEFLKKQLREINYLIDLSNELIYLNQLENKREEKKEKINLSQLLEKILENFKEYAKKENLKIEKNIQEDIFYSGVKIDFQKLFFNLIKNAIDYGKEGEKIEIFLEKENDKIIFKVKDFGMGVSKEEQKKIFDRFYKIDKSRQRQNSSAGLGLSIVQEIVQKYAGELKLKSEVGEGSEFEIVLG